MNGSTSNLFNVFLLLFFLFNYYSFIYSTNYLFITNFKSQDLCAKIEIQFSNQISITFNIFEKILE